MRNLLQMFVYCFSYSRTQGYSELNDKFSFRLLVLLQNTGTKSTKIGLEGMTNFNSKKERKTNLTLVPTTSQELTRKRKNERKSTHVRV